jgi:hypothetical protein
MPRLAIIEVAEGFGLGATRFWAKREWWQTQAIDYCRSLETEGLWLEGGGL